jgi:hypothetical protein
VWKGADTPEVSTVEVEGLPEYQVDTILSHKVQSKGRGRSVTLFLVKWKDFGDEHNSWEPESALTADGLYENLKLTEYWQSLARPPLPSAAPKPANADYKASYHPCQCLIVLGAQSPWILSLISQKQTSKGNDTILVVVDRLTKWRISYHAISAAPP